MIVTRGPEREQRSKLRSLAPSEVPVVMSSQAWEDYAVPGSPYFVLVEDGAIRGEGVATTWDALARWSAMRSRSSAGSTSGSPRRGSAPTTRACSEEERD